MDRNLSKCAVNDANLLGPAALTLALLSNLRETSVSAVKGSDWRTGAARVVNVASSAHARASLTAAVEAAGAVGSSRGDGKVCGGCSGGLGGEPQVDGDLSQYAAAKMGLLLFSRSLRRSPTATATETLQRGEGDPKRCSMIEPQAPQPAAPAALVTVQDCHPGLVWTDLLINSLLPQLSLAGKSSRTQKGVAASDMDGCSGGVVVMAGKARPLEWFRWFAARGAVAAAVAVLRPFFASPKQGAAVVLEAALRQRHPSSKSFTRSALEHGSLGAGALGTGSQDSKLRSVDSTTARAGTIASELNQQFAAAAEVVEVDSYLGPQGLVGPPPGLEGYSDEELDGAAEEVLRCVRAAMRVV